jgi:Arc/MetJ-type ribon-helix-helix transcriptional regulator
VTTQIAVRLDADDLGYLDRLVADHRARSRADAVRWAIDAARRRDRDAADVAAYAATDDDPELDALARHARASLDLE